MYIASSIISREPLPHSGLQKQKIFSSTKVNIFPISVHLNWPQINEPLSQNVAFYEVHVHMNQGNSILKHCVYHKYVAISLSIWVLQVFPN